MQDIHVSVVIPTKNPGAIFREVIDAATAQKAAFGYEILIIDSGSTDGTVEFVKAHPQLRLHRIAPETFGHGRTRNLAISLTSGPFVAFLTHDAIPVDEHWLANLVAAIEQAPEIAGAFGRHTAHRDASVFTQRDMATHFEGFLQHPLVLTKAMDEARYAHDVGWRQLLHFYSDNNSCLRRSVWQRHPYPDIEFAEDQVWARTIMEAGFAKAYAPDAVVYHSHDYPPISQLRRAFDEANAFRECFGYRLGAGPRAMLRSFVGLSMRDIRLARNRNLGLRATFKQIVRNAALVGGHLLGSHAHKLPKGLSLRLSHDKRLFHNLRTGS
jgi:rhamnosyltransferase